MHKSASLRKVSGRANARPPVHFFPPARLPFLKPSLKRQTCASLRIGWTFFHLVLSAPPDQKNLKILQPYKVWVADHRFKLEQKIGTESLCAGSILFQFHAYFPVKITARTEKTLINFDIKIAGQLRASVAIITTFNLVNTHSRLPGALVLLSSTYMLSCCTYKHIVPFRYDHPNILAGAGTMGLEIMEQVKKVDAVIVPVGGGGLIAGVAVAVKTLSPSTLVIVSPVQSLDLSKRKKYHYETIAFGFSA